MLIIVWLVANYFYSCLSPEGIAIGADYIYIYIYIYMSDLCFVLARSLSICSGWTSFTPVAMEMRALSIAFLVFFITWTNVDARKIVIFGNTDIPVKERLSIKFSEFPTNEGKGSFWVSREIFNEANAFLVREEARGIVFGGDMQVSAPRLARVKQELDEGLWRMLSIAHHVSGLPLKDTISRKGEDYSFHGSSFDLVCNACIEVSKQAEDFLSDPGTQECVDALANNICKILPSDISEKCNETLKTRIQEVIEVLQDYLSQEKLCIGTGLCHANNNGDLEVKLGGSSQISSLDVSNDRTCAVCEQFTGEALNYLSQNKTESEVLALLHQTCSELQGFSTECILLVDYYTPLFFLEVSNTSPEKFCQRINFCSGSSPLAVKPPKTHCDVCQSAIDEIKTELKDPEKQMKVIEMLLAGCKQVPNYANECKKLVFQYGPLILANVEQYLDTNDVCSQIHVCGSVAARRESNTDGNEPLIQLPFSEPSTHASLK